MARGFQPWAQIQTRGDVRGTCRSELPLAISSSVRLGTHNLRDNPAIVKVQPIEQGEAMKEAIHHQDEAQEYYTAERCHILELCNTPDDADVSIARARVAPGVTTRWHRLRDVTERYVMLAGSGLVEIGDTVHADVAPGDVVVIPPACRQRITNTGQDDLVFLAICSPRFTASAYEDCGID